MPQNGLAPTLPTPECAVHLLPLLLFFESAHPPLLRGVPSRLYPAQRRMQSIFARKGSGMPAPAPGQRDGI